MKVYSKFKNKYYDLNDVFKIVDPRQNAFYLQFENAYDYLVDVVGSEKKLVLCWLKSPYLKEMFDLWNKEKERMNNG